MSVRAPKFAEYSHDPQAVLDYPFIWKSWLIDVNDHIISATVELVSINGMPVGEVIDETPVVVGVVTFDDTLGIVVVWVSGGTLGNNYVLTCHIVTTDGRKEDKSIRLFVQSH